MAFDIPLRHVAENEQLRREWNICLGNHQTRKGDYVRSKSEMIIADLLFEHHLEYEYDIPLPDDSGYRPDFTIRCHGEDWYWEHWSMMDDADYRAQRDKKVDWYKKHFPGRLEETFETRDLTMDAEAIIRHREGTRG